MPRQIPFLSLKATHAPISEKLLECARRVIESGIYINGPECAAFSSELSSKLQLGHVVPVSNGLDAIRLILRGYMEMGLLNKGDEILVPANTYIATVLPVSEFGLEPKLVSPNLDTFGLDWEEASKLVGPKTKALITVHLYGTPSWDFEKAEKLRHQKILMIEDNAQSIGASITDPHTGKEHFTGALGDAAAFSFYPTKNVGALGDAGAVATTDPELAKTVNALANYGSTRRYYNEYKGFNCRMDEIQAAFLRLKLESMEEMNVRRKENAQYYSELIHNPGVILPRFLHGMNQVWHQYVIRTTRREELITRLAEAGIDTDVHYPISLFSQPCYSKGSELARHGKAYEKAQKLASEVLSLPIVNVSKKDIEKICSLI